MTCTLCQKQYTGQSRRSMAERHRNHRAEVKSAADGLGAHFHQHLLDRGVDPRADKNIELIVPYFDLTIIGSVNPDTPGAEERLNRLEADFQHRLMTMEMHGKGGINLQDETRRRTRNNLV